MAGEGRPAIPNIRTSNLVTIDIETIWQDRSQIEVLQSTRLTEMLRTIIPHSGAE
jgi:hypothetical protein